MTKLIGFLALSIAYTAGAPAQGANREAVLVLEHGLHASVAGRLPSGFRVSRAGPAATPSVLQHASGGGPVVWIAAPAGLPAELWIGAFRPSAAPLNVAPSHRTPFEGVSAPFRPTLVHSAYIRPVKELPVHNVDEEPRADLIPILEARDRFGEAAGYAAALMRFHGPSFQKRRFAGSECFVFFFDRPLESLPGEGWLKILEDLAAHFRSGAQIQSLRAVQASYNRGERVGMQAKVLNSRPAAAAVELRLLAKAETGEMFREVARARRVLDAGEAAQVDLDFRAPGSGLVTVRADLMQDPVHAEMLSREGSMQTVDRAYEAVVVFENGVRTGRTMSIVGLNLAAGGKQGFVAGTNYYPSSGWWEWAWRDYRPLASDEDFGAMRRAGYRMVRTFVEPVLDERTLRAMDASIYLASRHGITMDMTVSSQWLRTIGYERPDGTPVRALIRGPRDFNVYGISFRQMQAQREYFATLAARWRNAGNVIFNLSNETYLNTPDRSQMETEAREWPESGATPGINRDSSLIRRWFAAMTAAIRRAGAQQPIIPGHIFLTEGGGDSFLANRDGAIQPIHSYHSFAGTAAQIAYVDSACTSRPVILEEFGSPGWNDERLYDEQVHAALAAGAAAALSYEWGVRWLAPHLPFYSLPLRDILREKNPDPRWFQPLYGVVKDWPENASGIFPSPSGFHYASIYTGTPFPAAAGRVLSRVAAFGEGLQRAGGSEAVYVVVPANFNGQRTAVEPVASAMRKLWSLKVPFGVLQEECLARIPPGARVLICPNGVTRAAAPLLARAAAAGVSVFTGPDGRWESARELPRIRVTPGEGIELIARPAGEGRLYTLHAGKPEPRVSVGVPGAGRVDLGLDGFALIHSAGKAVRLVEATGDVAVDGAAICSIQGGRAVLYTSPGADLRTSPAVRVVAAGPVSVRFERPMSKIEILGHAHAAPLAIEAPRHRRTLEIDDQMAQYVVQVHFTP